MTDPFIICEIGSNWETLDHCLDSIRQAKECGADAAKFQMFTDNHLYGPCWDAAAKSPPLYWLPPGWLPRLKACADAVGIEFMCTAFGPDLLKIVNPFVKRHKIASSDANYPQLLHAAGKTRKPVLLSTGAASYNDIAEALAILDKYEGETTLLYCIASYPTRMVDFRVMEMLEEEFGTEVGFSDHTTDILGAPLMAKIWGASVIEKHVTFFPGLDTPDRPHSLTGEEFKTMVDAIRGTSQPSIGPTPEERPMVLRHSRRLIATREIKVGETLRYGENFGAYRALEDDQHGMSPLLWNHAEGPEGKIAKKPILRGKGIGKGDF